MSDQQKYHGYVEGMKAVRALKPVASDSRLDLFHFALSMAIIVGRRIKI